MEHDDGAELLDTTEEMWGRSQCHDLFWTEDDSNALYWFALVATPAQQILCALVALGKLEVTP